MNLCCQEDEAVLSQAGFGLASWMRTLFRGVCMAFDRKLEEPRCLAPIG
jgi:hypothetical protein